MASIASIKLADENRFVKMMRICQNDYSWLVSMQQHHLDALDFVVCLMSSGLLGLDVQGHCNLLASAVGDR